MKALGVTLASTCHTVRETVKLIGTVFLGRLISMRGGEIE